MYPRDIVDTLLEATYWQLLMSKHLWITRRNYKDVTLDHFFIVNIIGLTFAGVN